MHPSTTNIVPEHAMFTGLSSSQRVCLSSLTNTQGLPSHRLTYIDFAELRLAYPWFPTLPLWSDFMNSQSNDSFTAYVGVDWADTKHDVCVQGAGSSEREFGCIQHQVDDIQQWVLALHKRFGGPIAIAVELAKGPIVYALQKYDFLVIFPIHPLTLARYRQAFMPSGAKDDPTDAEFALDLLLHHPDYFNPLQPQSVEMRMLTSLVEQRRKFVDDKTRIINRLGDTLKQYYPQALDWFTRGVDTVLFCDFITRWPTLKQVKRARKNTLITFFHEHRL